MDQGAAAARLEGDLIRRCYSGLRGAAFQDAVTRAIHALLPVDAVFFATADPTTLLFSGTVAEEPLTTATEQFINNEFGTDDVNKFQSLATMSRHVATLDSATGGYRVDSARYREIMAPLGLGDELRAALVTPAGCWGYLCLHRAEAMHGFSPAEVRQIGRLAPHIGDGCRRSLAVPFSDAGAGAGPGVIVLHPDLTVAAITGEAERWLGHIPDHHPERVQLPAAVYAVAAQLQLIDLGDAQPGMSPSVRVPDIAGGWLLLHAARLHDAADADIAVVIEPAHPGSLTPLLLSTWGLSRRERDVAFLVLRGASTREIAAELHLSAYTVKDHIKSIFDKTGVRSRRDLVAHVLTGT